MISAIVLLARYSLQQPQLELVRSFPGGDFGRYVQFVSSSGIFKTNIDIYQENIFAGMGPTRSLIFSDHSVQLDPPLPTWLKFGKNGRVGFLIPKFLPDPYARTLIAPTLKGSDDDIVTKIETELDRGKTPGIRGSFRLGNNLPQLGYRIEVHPFFKDIRVNINYSGNWDRTLIDSIGETVGAVVQTEKGPPLTYKFLPNTEEIRTRAIATFDYFAPSFGPESARLHERIRYSIIKTCPTEFLRRWIDAAGKVDRTTLSNEPWAKEVMRYRDLVIDEVAKDSPSVLKYPPSDYKSMPVYFDLGGHLEFGITLLGPGGVLIHL